MPRISKDPEVRRAEIMDMAMELFAEKGFDETAVSDIVKRVGVAQGTFYYYFKTKQELMIAIMERSMEEQMEFIQSVADNERLSTRNKLDSILFDKPHHSASYIKMLEFVHHESNAWIHQKLVINKTGRTLPYVVKILEQGNKEGSFHVQSLQETAEFLVTALNFMMDPGFFQWTEEEKEGKIEKMKPLIGRLLGEV